MKYPHKGEYNKASAPIGAWEVKLEIMTDRQTDRQTNHPTDRRTHFQ